ncbi:MAG: hypothetical protein ABIA47_02990 [bacterium]
MDDATKYIIEKVDFIADKVVKHDEKIDFIAEKVVKHDKQIDFIVEKAAKHDEQIDLIAEKTMEHDGLLLAHGKQLDLIAMKVVEHDEQFDGIRREMFTKDDGRRLTEAIEGLTTIIKNMQEDHTFRLEWIKRLQNELEIHRAEIDKLKAVVGMS